MSRVDLAGKLGDARARVAAEHRPARPDMPKFARLTRKEARVREDQYAALSGLARTLMRKRKVKDERITENTLIRVAIDLLLAHQGALRGATEEELRDSVTSAVRAFRTTGVTVSGTSGAPETSRSDLPKCGARLGGDDARLA